MIKNGVDGDASIPGALSERADHLLNVRSEDVVVAKKEDMFAVFSVVLGDGQQLPGLTGARHANEGDTRCGINWSTLLRHATVIAFKLFQHLAI